MSSPDTLKVLGLATKESGQGVDVAITEIQHSDTAPSVRLLSYKYYPFQARFQDALVNAAKSELCSPNLVASLSFALGELLAAAAIDAAKCADVNLTDIDLVGSTGYTLCHQPEQVEVDGMWAVSTMQIGEPSVISERSGVTVVSDFHAADMAAGGQGGPIHALADYILFKSSNRCRAVQHIGDIGSVTYIPAGGRLDEVRAFDTGPGNTLIDIVVASLTEGKLTYDAGGAIGAAGKPDRNLIASLMDLPFIQKRPPKTVHFADVGWLLADKLVKAYGGPMEDLVATVTAFVVQSIARSYRRWLPEMPDDVVVGGKGSSNPTLMRRLAESLPGVNWMTFEDFGIDCQAGEALSVAILANEALRGRTSNIPSATGARRAVVLGKITPGRNFDVLTAKLK